jgi:putative methionine-R-sulfoxide reductase with GAF domain
VKTYRSAREVLGVVEQVLTPKTRLIARGHLPLRQIRGANAAESPLEAVAKLLESGRHYFAITIYLVAGERVLSVASAGPKSGCDSMRLGEGNVGQAAKTGIRKVVPDVSRDPQYVKVFAETRSELVMPIKIAAHVIGVIDVESERENAFAYQDRVLLEKVANVMAKFLVGHGKYLVMKAREAALAEAPIAARQKASAAQPVSAKQPQPERQARLRAAAGEKARS